MGAFVLVHSAEVKAAMSTSRAGTAPGTGVIVRADLKHLLETIDHATVLERLHAFWNFGRVRLEIGRWIEQLLMEEVVRPLRP